jgi:hypothetical protein
VKLAIDDFGTDDSSLAQLEHLMRDRPPAAPVTALLAREHLRRAAPHVRINVNGRF